MDWDEPRKPTAAPVTVGEPLDHLSIADLDARVAMLEAEIVRVRSEAERKRRQADAAKSLFKP